MVKNRNLAKNLASMWGSISDVNFLGKQIENNNVSYYDRIKIIKYWNKKVDILQKKFMINQEDSFIGNENNYVVSMCLKAYFEGEIIY